MTLRIPTLLLFLICNWSLVIPCPSDQQPPARRIQVGKKSGGSRDDRLPQKMQLEHSMCSYQLSDASAATIFS